MGKAIRRIGHLTNHQGQLCEKDQGCEHHNYQTDGRELLSMKISVILRHIFLHSHSLA